ncbi:hypothetical protein [Xanthomonas sp. SI]|uniref:hypothetical protein n=1 Tax=Xanthomonas sp. SI TaxID=2724123 RepID=UPI001C8DBC6D|nr:hypothetical protein [Xanthomonas sp. SI]
MKVAVYSARRYDMKLLAQANAAHGHELVCLQDALSVATVPPAPDVVSERHRHRPPALFTEEAIGQIMAAGQHRRLRTRRVGAEPDSVAAPARRRRRRRLKRHRARSCG